MKKKPLLKVSIHLYHDRVAKQISKADLQEFHMRVEAASRQFVDAVSSLQIEFALRQKGSTP